MPHHPKSRRPSHRCVDPAVTTTRRLARFSDKRGTWSNSTAPATPFRQRVLSVMGTTFALSTAALLAGCGGSDDPNAVNGTAPPVGATSAATPEQPAPGASPVDPTPTSPGGAADRGTCRAVPKCDAAPPPNLTAKGFRHTLSGTLAASAFANHRGRDLFLNPGDPQWVLGKFAYGVTDKDLKDEDVEIYLLRDCAGTWELLGTGKTTDDDAHAVVEGVADTGGRVFFEIPKDKALGVGRHRVRMVVKGDASFAELFLEIVPQGTPIFVSDIDGTLTTEENEEFGALLTGKTPDVNKDAPQAFQILVDKGYRPIYLTARPEFLGGRTREFLATHNFPPGIMHTTLTLTGGIGDAAAQYKAAELKMLANKGLQPAFGFGNKPSDTDAYDAAAISPKENRVFFQLTDTAHGGRRIESYTELLEPFGKLPAVCR